MTDTTIDGIDLTALQNSEAADATTITALSSQLSKLAGAPATDPAIAAEIAAIQAALTTLQQQETADEALIQSLSAKVAALPTTAASPTLTQAQIVAAIIAALGGSGTGTSTGTGTTTGTGTSTGTSAPNPFPLTASGAPDFQNAIKPSPENSTMLMDGGESVGAPYLIDKNNVLWRWAKDASGSFIPYSGGYGSGFKLAVNGVVADGAFQSVTVRQGMCYFTYDGGNIGVFEQPDSVLSGVAKTSMPPAWTSSGTNAAGQVASLPDMPPAPAASVPAPGSSNNTVLWGTGQTIKTLAAAVAAANAGDTVQAGPEMVGVTVTESVAIDKPLVIDLLGRAVNAGSKDATYTDGVLLAPGTLADPTGYAHQLGCLVPSVDVVIRGANITGFGMAETTHGGTAAIRNQAPCNIIIDHCKLWKNQNGVGPQAIPHTLKITNTILLDNGLGVWDGGSHNVYAGSGCVSFTVGPAVTSIVTQGGGGGHAIKSRAAVTTFVGPGFFYSPDATCIDIPDGSTGVVTLAGDITIHKAAGDANHGTIGYGLESALNGLAGVKCSGTTFDTLCDNPLLQTIGPIALDATCKFSGNRMTGPTDLVTGLA